MGKQSITPKNKKKISPFPDTPASSPTPVYHRQHTLEPTPPTPESTRVLSPTPNHTPHGRRSSILEDLTPNLTPKLLFSEPTEIVDHGQDGIPVPSNQLDVESRAALVRTGSPFYPQLPAIVDGASLLAAVENDPDAIYLTICGFIHDRNTAQARFKSAVEEHRSVLKDHKCARDTWSDLHRIEKAKQVVLWKFIDRLQRGDIKAPEYENGKRNLNTNGTPGNATSNSQLDEALSEALSIAESSTPSLPSFEIRSNDESSMTESMEWRMGNLDPSAVRSLFLLLLSINLISLGMFRRNYN